MSETTEDGWTRFRAYDPETWAPREPWPDDDCLGPLLVYDPCNGYELWRYHDEFTPPGTHWRRTHEPPADAVWEHTEHVRKLYGMPPLERRP